MVTYRQLRLLDLLDGKDGTVTETDLPGRTPIRIWQRAARRLCRHGFVLGCLKTGLLITESERDALIRTAGGWKDSQWR